MKSFCTTMAAQLSRIQKECEVKSMRTCYVEVSSHLRISVYTRTIFDTNKFLTKDIRPDHKIPLYKF